MPSITESLGLRSHVIIIKDDSQLDIKKCGMIQLGVITPYPVYCLSGCSDKVQAVIRVYPANHLQSIYSVFVSQWFWASDDTQNQVFVPSMRSSFLYMNYDSGNKLLSQESALLSPVCYPLIPARYQLSPMCYPLRWERDRSYVYNFQFSFSGWQLSCAVNSARKYALTLTA